MRKTAEKEVKNPDMPTGMAEQRENAAAGERNFRGRTARNPADCVTEARIGNSVLVVSGYFKKDSKVTAADKLAKVIEAEQRLLERTAV